MQLSLGQEKTLGNDAFAPCVLSPPNRCARLPLKPSQSVLLPKGFSALNLDDVAALGAAFLAVGGQADAVDVFVRGVFIQSHDGLVQHRDSIGNLGGQFDLAAAAA